MTFNAEPDLECYGTRPPSTGAKLSRGHSGGEAEGGEEIAQFRFQSIVDAHRLPGQRAMTVAYPSGI